MSPPNESRRVQFEVRGAASHAPAVTEALVAMSKTVAAELSALGIVDMLWNTGCNDVTVRAGATTAVYIVDPEPGGWEVTVQPNGIPHHYGAIFPWCSNYHEMHTKAFRVYYGTDANGPVKIYIYQNYGTSFVEYFVNDHPTSSSGFVSSGRVFPTKDSYLDITITPHAELPVTGVGIPPIFPKDGA
jgi:hypothetical protein